MTGSIEHPCTVQAMPTVTSVRCLEAGSSHKRDHPSPFTVRMEGGSLPGSLTARNAS